jgi:hypothetical protein
VVEGGTSASMAQLRLAAALLAVAFSAALAVLEASSVPAHTMRGVAMLARKEEGKEGAPRSFLRRIRSKALAASGTARLQKLSRRRNERSGKDRHMEWQGWLKRTLHDNEFHTHGNSVRHVHRRATHMTSPASSSSSTQNTAPDESCSMDMVGYGSMYGSGYGSGFSGSGYGSGSGSGSGTQQRAEDACEDRRYNEKQCAAIGNETVTCCEWNPTAIPAVAAIGTDGTGACKNKADVDSCPHLQTTYTYTCAWVQHLNSDNLDGEIWVGDVTTKSDCIDLVRKYCPRATIANVDMNVDTAGKGGCWCQFGREQTSKPCAFYEHCSCCFISRLPD